MGKINSKAKGARFERELVIIAFTLRASTAPPVQTFPTDATTTMRKVAIPSFQILV